MHWIAVLATLCYTIGIGFSAYALYEFSDLHGWTLPEIIEWGAFLVFGGCMLTTAAVLHLASIVWVKMSLVNDRLGKLVRKADMIDVQR